jgi:hypothetical protein
MGERENGRMRDSSTLIPLFLRFSFVFFVFFVVYKTLARQKYSLRRGWWDRGV